MFCFGHKSNGLTSNATGSPFSGIGLSLSQQLQGFLFLLHVSVGLGLNSCWGCAAENGAAFVGHVAIVVVPYGSTEARANVTFSGRLRRSRDVLVESCMCHHCLQHHEAPPTHHHPTPHRLTHLG